MRTAQWGLAAVAALVAVAALAVAISAKEEDDSGGATASAGQNTAAAASGVTVVGQGSVRVEPDRAIISIGAGVTAPTAAEAWNRSQDDIAKLGALFTSQFGIDEADITTEYVSIYPQYDFGGIEPRPNPPITGYRVDHTLSVRTGKLDQLGDIVDAATTAIGDDILLNGVTYTIDDPSALEGPARESAVRNAQRAAEDIAKLTGVDLGDIVAVEQLTTAASPAIDAKGGGAPVPPATGGGFYPGQTEVVVVLRVTFAIK